ncbi:MAG: DNA internalization-related competence protein ComEC/Rec2, partial [bacterium]|nr:DNA internalization-related competence protein ComEC/Rec2 [bacterium]
SGKMSVEGIVLSREDKGAGKRLGILVDTIFSAGEPVGVNGKVLLNLASGGDGLLPGDRVRFWGHLKRPRNFGNPGGFDYEAFLKERGIRATSFLSDDGQLAVMGDASPFWQALYSFRKRAEKAISAATGGDAAAVLSTITLGNKGWMGEDLADSFRKSGTAHLFAISGLHMGIVAYFFFYLLRWLLSRSERLLLSNSAAKFAALLTMIPLSIYLLASGMATSAVRAYIMVSVFLLSVVVEREGEVFNTLAAAALIILFIWPTALFEVGFQLSFTAVISIVYMVPRLEEILLPAREKMDNALLRKFYLFILVSIAASVGSAPLIAHYFMELSLVAVFSNLFLIPLLGFMAVPLASLGLFSSLFSVQLATIFFIPAALLSDLAIFISSYISALPFASILVSPPGMVEIIFYYMFLITVFRLRGRVFFSSALIIPLIFASLSYLGASADHSKGRLEVDFLSVGQGESTLISFPNGKTMLIDGGGFYNNSFDTGKMIIRPFLLTRGIKKIDYMVLTHPHPDHMYGLLHLLKEFEIGKFWLADGPAIDDIQKDIMDITVKKGIKRRMLSADDADMDIGGARVEILNPATGFSGGADSDSKINNCSIVMRVAYGDIAFMLTADLELEGERKILSGGRSIKADVIKVPHHGSLTSSSVKFIKKVAPEYALFSVGHQNRFRFPREEVVKRYLDEGAKILRTDISGAVSFNTDGKVLTMETFR